MKKSLILLIGIIFIAAACTGSSGTSEGNYNLPGGGQISYTTNVTPENISGCYKITGTVTKNTCDIPMSDTSTTVTICLAQDDADVVITASSSSSGGSSDSAMVENGPVPSDIPDPDINTASAKATGGSGGGGSVAAEEPQAQADILANAEMEDVFAGSNLAGEVSGNQFLVEVSATQTYDGCTVTFAAAYVGTVIGDAITGTNQGAVTATGDCSSLGENTNCVTAIDYSGSRSSSSSGSDSPAPSETANAESNIPAGSSIDSGATIPMKSISKKSSGWFIIRK